MTEEHDSRARQEPMEVQPLAEQPLEAQPYVAHLAANATETTIGPPVDEAVLRTRDLTLRYGKYLAVDRLNLNVTRGEIYGFLGRNGAGKTSTIRMIMGICRADQGTIEFEGKTVRRIGKQQKQKIGYVSQEQFFYPWMTCARIGKFVGGLYPTWEQVEFDRLLKVLDLPPTRKIAHLSGGMKVKLALTLALAHRPTILILDEPTAGLDPVARREFLDIIHVQSKQHNRTTFFSSHLIGEVERVADRVGIIHRGRLEFEGPLEKLREQVREIHLPPTSTADSPELANLATDTFEEKTAAAGLKFLRRGFQERRTAIYQGTESAWSRAAELGIGSQPLSLEDAFIGLASEVVGQV